MLKTAKIIQPGSFTAKDMGRDMTNALLLSADEGWRPQLQQQISGRMEYLAQLILDYHKATSGGDWMTAQRDARTALETMADEMAEDLNIANMLPSSDEEMPADHAGLFGILTMADNQAKINPAAFDTGDVNRWMNLLAKDQIDQVRQEMVSSGKFSAHSRYREFIDRTKSTMEFYENLAREKVAERAGKEELKLQKADDSAAMAPETNIGDITDPELRAEIEERAKAQAEFEARERAKLQQAEEGRKDMFRAINKPQISIPGFDEFMDDLSDAVRDVTGGEIDEEMRGMLTAIRNEITAEAEMNPDNWQESAVAVMKKYPEFQGVVGLMEDKVKQDKARREERVKAPNRPPQEIVPESQKAEPEDEGEDPDFSRGAAIISKNQEYDAHKGQGPWELDKEAKAIRRRKIMVANAVFGRPPVPFAIGETVGFSRGSALDSGKITAITAEKFVIETSKGKVEIPHEAVFETASTGLF